MIAAGIDLGGTKAEVQLFDADWQMVARERVPTPQDYDELVRTLAGLVAWVDARAGGPVPVGIGAAGLVNPQTGLALTANLPASDRPLPGDVNDAVGRHITYVNDCRSLALSEAVFGAGQGFDAVAALILGTGVGGGLAVGGRLVASATGTGGEFGHTAAPAHIVAAHDLPIVRCGCGRMGCIETLIAGPGLSRIAQRITGAEITPPQIAEGRASDPALAQVWDIWCALVAELLHGLTMTVDPQVIVLGGGLSKIAGVVPDLQAAQAKAQLSGFRVPQLMLAEGGDSSGARGAAYAAKQEASDE